MFFCICILQTIAFHSHACSSFLPLMVQMVERRYIARVDWRSLAGDDWMRPLLLLVVALTLWLTGAVS